MNMVNEKMIDLHLVQGASRVPARLYVRFNPDGVGVYLRLTSNGVDSEVQRVSYRRENGEVCEVTPVNFLQALAEGLLPGLMGGIRLELAHIVEVFTPTGESETASMQEEIALQHIDDEPIAVFTLRCELDRRTYEITQAEDVFYAFRELAERMKGACRICGYCSFGRIVNYGGDDWRHGLFCFRDNPDAYEKVKCSSDFRVWASQSWSNVDAFHSCPSFRLADAFQSVLAVQTGKG